MTASRRVLFLAGTLGVGGAERQLLYMLQVLVERGHRPEVVALEGGVFADRIRELGVPLTVLEPVSGPARRLVQVTRAVRRADPDVVQASHNWVSAYVAVAGRLLRLPAIGALRSEPAETIGEVGRLGHLAIRLPKLIATNSVATIDATVELGIDRERLVHLPNAIDTERFHPSPTDPAQPSPGPFSLLGIGRLTERKRFDLFLDVVARVVADLPATRAVLVGDGPEKAALVAKADALGLADHLGWRETDDPRPDYRRADLLVFTSGPLEGMPNVVLEAMATGVPVVAFESGDVARVVIDGVTGRLIEPNGDTAAMTAAVKALIADRETLLTLGAGARDHVVAAHSLEALGVNLDRLHGRAMGVRTPSA